MRTKKTTKVTTPGLKLRKKVIEETVEIVKKCMKIDPDEVEHNQRCTHVYYSGQNNRYQCALCIDDEGKIEIANFGINTANLCILTGVLATGSKNTGVKLRNTKIILQDQQH